MSSEDAAALPALNSAQRRVLGVLVEKAKTTPDAYPLSLNALVTGCNQKSNREPIMDMHEVEVEETLAALGKDRLVLQVTGTRVDRWRHNLYESWKLGKVELAVLTELLLRGPQSEGELRGRASRMEPIPDLPALRAVLQPLAERKLVVYVSPEGRRGAVLTHGFHTSQELEQLKVAPRPDAETPEESSSAPRSSGDDGLQRLVAEVEVLQRRLTKVEERLLTLENPGKVSAGGTS